MDPCFCHLKVAIILPIAWMLGESPERLAPNPRAVLVLNGAFGLLPCLEEIEKDLFIGLVASLG